MSDSTLINLFADEAEYVKYSHIPDQIYSFGEIDDDMFSQMLISPTINKTPTFKKVEIINNGRNITSDNENTIYIASTKVVLLCPKRKIPRLQQTIHKQKRNI